MHNQPLISHTSTKRVFRREKRNNKLLLMTGTPKRGSSASRSNVTNKGKNKMKVEDEWFETVLHPDLKLSLGLKRVIRRHKNDFQDIVVLDTKGFGRVLVIDGKPRSAEADGFVYYESLVHPALLMHDNPKKVFIIGGGEGSAAREVLKHKTIERVVLCEEEQDLVNLCHLFFEENWGAFADPRLEIVNRDARAELETRKDKFDVIIGDLPGPSERGSCNVFYTQSFYQSFVKPRLNDGGIFVTHAGLAGIRSPKVFASVFNTLRLVFPFVLPVTVAVSLQADNCGWVMASESPLLLSHTEMDQRINTRINGALRYHDGASILVATIMNKIICKLLDNYSRDYIIDEDI